MASQSVSNFSNWMKEKYWPLAKGGVEEAFYRSEGLLARLKKKDAGDLLVGKQLIVPVHSTHTRTGGARSETGTLPTASPQGVEKYTFTVVHRYWPISITGAAIDLTKGPTAAFANALDFEVRNAVKDMRNDMNMAAFTDGSGILAAVTASNGGATTVTVDDTRYLEVGQYVSVAAQNGGVIVTDGATDITAIDHSTKIVTLTNTVTATTAHALYRTGGVAAAQIDTYQNDLWGLQYAVHDGTTLLTSDVFGPRRTGSLYTTFAGIDRSSYAYAASKLIDGTAGIDEDFMMRAFNVMRLRGGKPSVCITSEHQWRAIGQMLHGPVVWNNFVKNIDFGYKALSFQGVDIIWDVHCPPTVMYILDESCFYWGEVRELGFMKYDGQEWVRASTTDAINAQLVWRGQLVCTNPYCQIKVYGLPSGTAIYQ
jgi:hypothetical protein